MLDGLGIRNFRSFGDELQLLPNLRKVNLVAGPNNSGKSNILRFLDGHLRKGQHVDHDDFDAPQSDGAASDRMEIALAIRDDDERILRVINEDMANNPAAQEQFRDLLNTPALRLTDDSLVWFRFTFDHRQPIPSAEQCVAATDQSQYGFANASKALTQQHGGSRGEDARRVLNHLDPLSEIPLVEMIGAFRKIESQERLPSQQVSHDGVHLIRELQKLQNPDPGPRRRNARRQFAAINQFVRAVLEDESANIEVPHSLQTLTLQQGAVELPLESFGTGIQHVIILAVAATVLENRLVCVEEPEVHLHPLLQRKLIRYLSSDSTSNQYMVATHSAQMLDFERATVCRVIPDPTGSKVTAARDPAALAEICADLGYRPSDLLQSNSVLWVEGPSDRIYLRAWIALVDLDLIEGIHYSIMFYGGRLLNHLTVNDPEVKDFISLRRLNRNIAILIDSDKQSSRDRLADTKRRIRDEFGSDEYGFAWVTRGYTIENYVPNGLLREVVDELYPKRRLRHSGDRWKNPLVDGRPRYDKIKIATAVCARWSLDDMPADLLADVRRVVRLIQRANGIAAQ